MSLSLVVVGTNHNYSPIELREKISFSQKRLSDALGFLSRVSSLRAAVIISTCNRVEIYASADDSKEAIKQIEEFICCYHEIARDKFTRYLYKYSNERALAHLSSVACGLDSLVLGETQILGQIKQAFNLACSSKFMDQFLRKVFTSALSCSRKVQLDTQISKGKVSVPSIAIDFIKQKLGDLFDKTILIIGVGKISELVLKYLTKHNPNVIFISNRTFTKAQELARKINAQAVNFEHLNQYLKKADVVISATASPHYVIKEEMLKNIENSKLLVIDLALPRDVEPEVRNLAHVELFCLEDLTSIIEENKQKKHLAAECAEEIIEKESRRIWQKLTKLEQEPALLP